MVHPDLPLSARWVRFYSRNRLRIREKENAALLRENNRPRGGATKRGYFYLHSSVRPFSVALILQCRGSRGAWSPPRGTRRGHPGSQDSHTQITDSLESWGWGRKTEHSEETSTHRENVHTGGGGEPLNPHAPLQSQYY